MSIATAINDLSGRIQDAYEALSAKGATMPEKKDTWHLSSTIESIPTGGGQEPEENDLIFIDYDGKILYSYTKQEGLALTELPQAPQHEGLTFQEWNYTLANMKTVLTNCGGCCVGATYTPTDEHTHIFVEIPSQAYSSVTLYWWQSSSSGNLISWGDGTSEVVRTVGEVTLQHTYEGQFPAKYEIVINCRFGYIQFNKNIFNGSGGQPTSLNPSVGKTSILKEIWFGKQVTRLQYSNTDYYNAPLSWCESLRAVVIPKTLTQHDANRCFAYSKNLVGIVLPHGTTTLKANLVYRCSSLKRLSIPFSVRYYESNLFQYCESMERAYIPTVFEGSLGNSTFQGDVSLQKIYLPDGWTIFPYAFLYGCHSMTNVSFPSALSSMENNVFYQSYSILTYDFSKATQIPTIVADTFKYTSINNNMKILVPSNLYEDWKTAENWSAHASRIYSAT